MARKRKGRRATPGAASGIGVGTGMDFPDSLLIRKMSDYRKMSRSELLAWIEKLKSRHAAQTRTRQERATMALRDSEERLRAILETAVEGIVTIDARGLIESANPAAEKIFGYKARELVGKNVSLLMPSPDRQKHDSYLSNYVHTGHAKIIGIGREVSGRRKDGTVFPMDLSVSEVKLADRRLFTGFIRDITDRKRLEKEVLEIIDREQRRIGYDLHDGLCQHLAGIELMSLVLENQLAPRSKSAAARVGVIARNVREAIRHTRSLARGLSPVTLEAEGLTSGLRELAISTGKIFHVTCDFDQPGPVRVHDHAVANNLFRIAQESVSNAIKHGRAKRISINLDGANEHVVLRVSDNGSGFSGKTSRRKGMGLRIMQSRAGMIGGSFAVEQNARGGITVVCTAPNPALKKKERHAR